MDSLVSFLRKVFIFFLAFFLLFYCSQEKGLVIAEEKIAETSAYFNFDEEIKDSREKKLTGFLKSYRSPLADYAFFIIETADQYGLDWKLLPAIAGLESGFGKAIPANSFNAYGWNNGRHYFRSWPDGIEYVSMKLKENYLDRGAKTVEQIGSIYAESPTWASRVRSLMDEIESSNQLSLLQFSL